MLCRAYEGVKGLCYSTECDARAALLSLAPSQGSTRQVCGGYGWFPNSERIS